MTESIKTLTEKLKEEIASSQTVIEYLRAREAYQTDSVITTMVNEYNVQGSVYEQESQKEPKDTLLLTSIKTRMEELYKKIIENKTMQEMQDAENAVNELYNEIVGTLQSVVVPEEEHSCGGDCSSCHGCH